jgi:hypothetical protein
MLLDSWAEFWDQESGCGLQVGFDPVRRELGGVISNVIFVLFEHGD